MKTLRLFANIGLAAMVATLAGSVRADLPKPTPAEAEAAALKKAQAAAQAEKDKQALLATMDAITARWRSKAAAAGWRTYPPVPVAAPASAVSMPTTQAGSSGQPGGRMGAAAQAAPVRSEKSGTARPSADVKQAPSQPLPRRPD